jgi:translation initiation factor 5B
MPPKNKGKKGKANDDDYWETAGVSAENYNAIGDKIGKSDDDRMHAYVAAQAEDEFPEPEKTKKKKKKGKNDDDVAPDVPPSPAPAHNATVTALEDDEDGEGADAGESDPKKKKKKKKGKKDEDTAPAAAPTPPPPAPANNTTSTALEDDEDVEEAGVGETDPKKKKKKKKGKKDEDVVSAVAPTPAPAKKSKGGLSALKAMMEEKKRLEEEARRLEEEERKRIEEEERQAEEEAKRKEEEKQRKKEKEKAKLELAKKEGRYMTKKQKEEKAAAELRRQALLASGVQIEGLQQQAGTSAKKVAFGNRKKKGPLTKEASASPAPESRPETPDDILEASPPSHVEPAAEEAKLDGVKDEWDASSGDESDESVDSEEMQQEQPDIQTGVQIDQDPPDVPQADSRTEKADAGTAQAHAKSAQTHAAATAVDSKDNKDNLRSPICCILGHVDTGKTKLLDKIRQTNVQEGEAGGITQQIGATYFPLDAIKTKTAVMNKDNSQEYKIPGLLVIDTPGHESFTNLRSRGSSLCNIAILVVDIMHGLEPQTLESLRLLRDKKTPFIVALNKIDRLYGWKETPDGAFQESLAKQKRSVQREFEDRVQKTILAFAEQGLNAVLYYENKSFARNVSLVPTSAITGEGIPDMIMLLVNLTQQRMSNRLMYLSELECTVLEVKVVEGLGTTIDVVLSNGILREGDKVVVCGLNGPIVTQVRALLTPQPLRELRIKSAYVHHKEVKAALGVKLVAPDLDKAVAGSRLLVVGPDDDEEALLDEVMSDLTSLLDSVDKSGRGVCVQASTLGSLEALLDFLKVSKIPVSGINIGPVHKKDVMRAATMLEKAKELAVILCFDVPVDKDTEKLAEEMGIKLFKADIIYHLFDAFTAYNNEIMEAKRRDAAPQAVWPCRLKIIAAFCKRDPIILGVDILDGTLRVGTPICVVAVDPTTQKKEIIDLGKVTSLEINHKSFDIVKKSQSGGGVAVKIEHAVYESGKMFGRHFDEKDELFSHITRQSIDVLKTSFKADVSNEEWLLIRALKPHLNVQ